MAGGEATGLQHFNSDRGVLATALGSSTRFTGLCRCKDVVGVCVSVSVCVVVVVGGAGVPARQQRQWCACNCVERQQSLYRPQAHTVLRCSEFFLLLLLLLLLPRPAIPRRRTLSSTASPRQWCSSC
jgi:hypothetical protein